MSTHASLSLLGFGVFALVWAGRGLDIAKIARRDLHPPSFDLVVNGAHLGRFTSWALVGAATLSQADAAQTSYIVLL